MKQCMITDYMVNDCCLIDIPTYMDKRGTISVIDKELPFEVKRIFWLYHIVEGEERGSHALLDSSEIIISVHGSFVVDLTDGINKKSVILDNPDKGLIIKPGIWFRTHSYKNEGISLILASSEYSRDRYTYSYNDFIKLRNKTE